MRVLFGSSIYNNNQWVVQFLVAKLKDCLTFGPKMFGQETFAPKKLDVWVKFTIKVTIGPKIFGPKLHQGVGHWPISKVFPYLTTGSPFIHIRIT